MSSTSALHRCPQARIDIRLSAQASQVGERGQNRVDQLSGQRSVAAGQAAAEHFSQSANRLALAITAAFRIEPTAIVTEKIVESTADAAGVFQEAQVGGHPPQHLLFGVLIPETNAEPQGPSVVVGRVAAFAPRNTVDGMLDQPGRVGHAIQMVQSDPVTNVHHRPPCTSCFGCRFTA